jgi:hypothetical protein
VVLLLKVVLTSKALHSAGSALRCSEGINTILKFFYSVCLLFVNSCIVESIEPELCNFTTYSLIGAGLAHVHQSDGSVMIYASSSRQSTRTAYGLVFANL